MAVRRGNKANFLIVFVSALGSFSAGFTVNVIGSVLGMNSFYEYFNIGFSGDSALVGGINGCYFGGGVVGAVFGAWICQRLGRRYALLITCVLGVTGGILQGAAVHISMILIGRLFSGISSGGFQTIVPIYQSEISPPSQRGRMVGAHGFMNVCGAAAAIWIGLGASFSDNGQVQWRLTLAFAVLSPFLLGLAFPWLPESPRWLVSREYHEKALQVLEMLHKTPEDADALMAREEYLQIRQQLELEKHQRTSWRDAITYRPMQKRLFLGALLQFLLQGSGVLVLLNYQVILLGNLGINGWLGICLLGIYTTYSAVLNYVNALLVDRVGRVRMILAGLGGGSLALTGFVIMVALFAGTDNRVGCGFGVFFIYAYTTFYALFLDVTSYIYCAEIFPTYARTAGMATSIVSYYCTALVFGQAAPTAFATIGWRYYILFILIPVCGLPLVWKYFPETKNLSLEEVAAVFGDEVALDITHLGADERANLDAKVHAAHDEELVGDSPRAAN